MNLQKLLDDGWNEFPPNKVLDECDRCFAKLFPTKHEDEHNDDRGNRIQVVVRYYDHRHYPNGHEGLTVDLYGSAGENTLKMLSFNYRSVEPVDRVAKMLVKAWEAAYEASKSGV